MITMLSSPTARLTCRLRSAPYRAIVLTVSSRLLSTAASQSHTSEEQQRQPEIGPADYRHKSNLTSLPPHLKTALTSLLSPAPPSDSISPQPQITGPRIRSASLRIFDSLRSTTGTVNPSRTSSSLKIPSLANPDRHLTPHHLAYDHETCLAYLAARFPACFTGIKRVLSEVLGKIGPMGPASVLDVGTGPGTAVWALRAVEDELASDPLLVRRANVTAVDVNPHMLNVAKQLARAGNMQGNVDWVEYMPASLSASFDMSIAAYVFGEIEDAQMRQRLLKSMWRLTNNVLVLVDRGTPHGYQRMLEARDWFISQSKTAKEGEPQATILAPCPHMAKCPLAGNGRDWCHFSQRMERPMETQRTKHAKSNLEDIKFSYLVIQKHASGPVPPRPLPTAIWPRVLSVPLKRGGHVLVDVCTPRGTADRMIVTKSLGKDTYKAARKLGWGDQWPFAAKVFVPGRGMGRVVEDDAELGEKANMNEKKKDRVTQAGGKEDVGANAGADVLNDETGVLFAAGPAPGPRLTLVEPRVTGPPPAAARSDDPEDHQPAAEPRATRGGRAARGSKKPVSPFAALLAQQQPAEYAVATDASSKDPEPNSRDVGHSLNPRE